MAEPSDYVVVGGGSAGCILAARLSEDPRRRVTLLEAGPPDTDPWIHVPAGYARMLQRGRHDWAFRTEAEPELAGRSLAWPRGRVLGGSGSINGLVFLRGSPLDYDRWAQSGARGWAWEDVLPTFRRLESWEGAAGETRGKDGPVPVSTPRQLSEGALAFIAACQAAGFPLHRDINDGAIEGVAPIQMNVRRGRRVSTARAYLRPARHRPNLRVLTGMVVRRVVVAAGRATGVLARHADGREELFSAAAEVVLAAGAIGTPTLLLHSGIGDGTALGPLGIATVHHAPGVGRNLQDHLIARMAFRTCPAGTLNERAGTALRRVGLALGYALHRSGPLAIGATEATLFARLTPGAEEAEAQLQFINFSMAASGDYRLAAHPGVMINFGQCRPDSRGELTLRSPDPAEKPVIRPNYLSAPGDVRLMTEAALLTRRIGRTAPFADLVAAEEAPAREVEGAEALLEHVRRTGGTVYHPCGTCRMGGDDAAVLDPQLRLRGVAGLRVADASAFPLVPSGNIQPAVMMLAERAAAMMRGE